MKNLSPSSDIHHTPFQSARRVVLETIDSAIAALATPQHGVVTREQLLALGLTDGAILYRTRIGRLHRLYRGVYAVGHYPVSPLAHAMAAVLACGAGAALSHGSAATLWGVTAHWRSPLEVTAGSARRRPQLHLHRSSTLTSRDITVHFGITVTSPARTLLDIAERLGDVALARAVNDLRHARFLWLADLAELLARHPQTRTTNRLRKFLAHPERAPTRSELEDAFLRFLERYGLPEPIINTRVAGHEVDVLFPAHRLVVELDGYDFHDGREQFEIDRDRDADLLTAGIATVRVTSERVKLKPAREAARLHAILASRAPGG
jgi:predicted transcriptional regulator of viral defense system